MSKAINVSAALNAAQQINQTRAALAATHTETAAKIAALKAENVRLHRLPLPKAEVLEQMLKSVDVLAAQFISAAGWRGVFEAFAQPKGDRPPAHGEEINLQHHAATKHPNALSLQDVQFAAARGERAMEFLIGLGEGNVFSGTKELDALDGRRAAFFFGDRIKERIVEHFDRLCPEPSSNVRPLPGDPATSAARLAKIAENTASIEQLTSELGTLELQIAELRAAAAGGV